MIKHSKDQGVSSSTGRNERDWTVNSKEAEDFWTNRYGDEEPEAAWVSHRWWEDEGLTLADFPPLDQTWRQKR